MSKPYSSRVWEGEQITFRIKSTARIFTVKSKRDRITKVVRGFAAFDGTSKRPPYRILDRDALINWLDTGELEEIVPVIECGSCSCYHRVAFGGDCRDDAERFPSPEEAAERLNLPTILAYDDGGYSSTPDYPPTVSAKQ